MNKILLVLLMSSSINSFASDNLTKNEHIVLSFYDLAFNQHHTVDAAMKFLAVKYIQHNPGVADGRQGFIDAFPQTTKPDLSTVEFKRTISENDLVVLHSHAHDVPGDLGYAVVDIFRVQNGLIVEHWDVGQKVPATSKNNNTMF